MKTKKEILDYVVGEIERTGRALSEDKWCMLENEAGARCAFSLCMTDAARTMAIGDNGHGNFIVQGHDEDEINAVLKPEFHGHSRGFWENVQKLHDDPLNWYVTDEGTKLSVIGREAVTELENY